MLTGFKEKRLPRGYDARRYYQALYRYSGSIFYEDWSTYGARRTLSSGEPVFAKALHRDSTGVLWAMVEDRPAVKLELYTSTNGALTWTLYDTVLSVTVANQPDWTWTTDDNFTVVYVDTDDDLESFDYTVATKTTSASRQIVSGTITDPVILVRPDGVWWVIYGDRDGSNVYVRQSFTTDGANTVDSTATLFTRTKVGGGHVVEDLGAINCNGNDAVVLFEDEEINKSTSSVKQLYWDDSLTTWTDTTVIPSSGTIDYEGAAPFGDPAGDPDTFYFIVAHNGAGGNTYDKNQLYLYKSTDNALTWSLSRTLLSEHSHVEYGVYIMPDKSILIRDNRNFQVDAIGATDADKPAQIIHMSSINSGDVFDIWEDSGEVTIVVDDGFAIMHDEGSERGFLPREADRLTNIAFTANLQAGGSTVDLRLGWGYEDVDNHFLLILKDTTATIYERTAGTYAQIGSAATSLGPYTTRTWYEVKVQFSEVTSGNYKHAIYVDGALVLSVDDATAPAGTKVCISCGNNHGDHQPVLIGVAKCQRLTATAFSADKIVLETGGDILLETGGSIEKEVT